MQMQAYVMVMRERGEMEGREGGGQKDKQAHAPTPSRERGGRGGGGRERTSGREGKVGIK